MTEAPNLVLENRFHAPPRFVKEWMTDYRADDGRFFGDATPFRVVRQGHVVRREQDNPMGLMAMTVDVAAEDRWTVRGDQRDPQGNVLFSFVIRESVRPHGDGTLHRVEMTVTPSPPLAGALPQMVEQWRASLTAGFGLIEREIAMAAKGGKAPTA